MKGRDKTPGAQATADDRLLEKGQWVDRICFSGLVKEKWR